VADCTCRYRSTDEPSFLTSLDALVHVLGQPDAAYCAHDTVALAVGYVTVATTPNLSSDRTVLCLYNTRSTSPLPDIERYDMLSLSYVHDSTDAAD